MTFNGVNQLMIDPFLSLSEKHAPRKLPRLRAKDALRILTDAPKILTLSGSSLTECDFDGLLQLLINFLLRCSDVLDFVGETFTSDSFFLEAHVVL